jgi:hypothetical protein
MQVPVCSLSVQCVGDSTDSASIPTRYSLYYLAVPALVSLSSSSPAPAFTTPTPTPLL